MINLFQIPANDQSIYYLGQIFGYVGTVLPVKDAPLLLGIMFKVLNTMALTIGAFVVVYITIVGMLATAHEGEFLGKKWSGLWVPIRTAIGIAALFPTASGYSAIQILAMWIIVQGIGAADTLWTTVLKYVNVTGSPYASVNVGSVDPSTLKANMQTLFQALTCQASAKATYDSVPVPDGSIQYFCSPSNTNSFPDFCNKSDQEMLNIHADDPSNLTASYPIGPNGSCGMLQFCNLAAADMCGKPNPNGGGYVIDMSNKSSGCLACQAQHKALQVIVSTLGGVAKKFVDLDHDYLQFYYKSDLAKQEPAQWIKDYCSASGMSGDNCQPQPSFNKFPAIKDNLTNIVDVSDATAKGLYLPYPLNTYLEGNDFINAAVAVYLANTVGAVSQSIESQMQSTNLSDTLKAASDRGWILAGSYYYELAGMNKKNVNAANLFFSTPANTGSSSYPVEPMTTQGTKSGIAAYRNNYSAMKQLTDTMSSSTSANQSFINIPGAPDILSSAGGTLLSSFKETLTENKCQGANCVKGQATNPIISIATFGYQLMITAQFMFALILTVMVGVIIGSNINFMVAGNGLTLPPFGEAVKAIFSFVGPFFILLFVSLFTLGGMLGIYVPLIPYIIFIMGAIGWMMATIESMVAAPFVALGILGPGGQHEILGRGEPAVMLIFNVFLRPSLMVFGLLAAMLASIPVIKLINAGFLSISEDIIKAPGLFEEILFIAAYASLIVTALNKIFSLIFIIPERVLTWIGGPAVQYGEAEALGAIKHGVEGAGGAAAGAGRETGAAAYGGAMGYAQSRATAQEYGGEQVTATSGGQAARSAAAEAKKAEEDKKKGGGGAAADTPVSSAAASPKSDEKKS